VGPNVLTNIGAELDFAFTFALNSLTNATAFEAIFDKYRIRQVRVRFLPFATEAVLTSGTTAGPLYTAIDYDDNAATTIANLASYDNVKTSPIGTLFERILTPKAALAAYSGVFTSFASAPNGMWMDVASPTVQYYGLKGGVPIGTVANGTVLWNTQITLEIEFKHPR